MIRRFTEHEPQNEPSGDELQQIKADLRTAERDFAVSTARQFPKTTVVLAFAAGAAFAGVPTARRLIWAAGLWGAKRAIAGMIGR